ADIAPDASILLFDEEGEAGGANYTVFIRKSDHSPVVRLGEGNALSVSPDGRWALSMSPAPKSPFVLLPTGTGEHKTVATPGLQPEQAASWLPDSATLIYAAEEPGHRTRLFVQAIDSGQGKAISPEGIDVGLPGFAISPAGK